MTLLFACFFALNAVLLVILIGQSRSYLFDCLAGSAVNPLFIFCLISILFNIDFIVVWNNPEIDFLEQVSSVSQATILDAYGAYTFLFFGTVLGFIAALSFWARRVPGPRAHALMVHEPAATLSAQILFYAVLSAQILFCAVLGFSIPILLWFNYHPPLENLSYQVIGRENPILGIATWLIPAAATLFTAYRPRPFSAIVVSTLGVAVALIAMSGGARNPVLLVLLIIGVAYANSKRISVLWYAPIIPGAILFLTFSGYVFRESGKYESFADFIALKGGLVKLFFGGEEMSFAKVFSTVYELAPSLPRAPFESVLALLVLPIPRSVFAMKPFGASAAFTQQISPLRWEWTKSETLVTGYGDVYWQFGTLGAFIAMFVLGFLWLWFCLKVIHSSRQIMIVWTPLLIWWMYMFVRGDLFNIGLLLWPAVMMILLHRLLQHTIGHFPRQR
jgi:hypothetical protein